MTPQPTFTFPVSFRQVDKPIFDALVSIAQKEGCNVTTVFRTALTEFVESKTRSDSAGRRLDEFLDKSAMSAPVYHEMLTPAELRSGRRLIYFMRPNLCEGERTNSIMS